MPRARPAGVHGARIQQGADLVQRPHLALVTASAAPFVHIGDATIRPRPPASAEGRKWGAAPRTAPP